jgi:hypothetical protein
LTDPTPEAVRERKLRQIQTLLDLASDERTPEGERETAMNRAMALMAAHGVTDMMVDAARRAKTDEIIEKSIPMTDPYSYEKMMLAFEIGSALNCQARYTRWGRTVELITLYGFRSDIERVELFYTSLLLQAVNAVRHERPDSYWGPTAAETRKYRKNWLMGFAHRVGMRIAAQERAAREKYDQDHQADGQPGTELVVATRRAQVLKYYDDRFASAKKGRKSRRSYGDHGYADGGRAGARAKLDGGTGVTSGNRSAIGR